MEETKIQGIVNKNKLNISRIPSWAKEIFTERARIEFCDDYGMCLAAMIKECEEYNQLKKMFLNNQLNTQIIVKAKEEELEEEGIVFGNGKKLNLNGGKK